MRALPPPPWSVSRARNLALQAAVLGGALAGAIWLAGNTLTNLDARGIAVGWGFLGRSAYFPVSQSVLPYSPSDSIAWAFVVGLGNTLVMSVLIAILATGLGFALAMARRSSNLLASGVGAAVVDLLRNTPVVVQLLFWYSLLTLGLPDIHKALHPAPGLFLSNRGVYAPSVAVVGPGWATAAVCLCGLAGLGLAASARFGRGRRRPLPRMLAGLALWAAAGIVWVLAGLSLGVESPRLRHVNFLGGLQISPEFGAMALGLVLYSSVYVGEIIRGGIDAVARGQWEAARALGLSEPQALRLIILPQALRTIIPPLTSQYINIVKNTTLALVVGYPDISFIAAAAISQTGQAVEAVLILMGVFLLISLLASAAMNVLNRRFALPSR